MNNIQNKKRIQAWNELARLADYSKVHVFLFSGLIMWRSTSIKMKSIYTITLIDSWNEV